MQQPSDGERYLMPAVFGPTRIPNRSEIPDVHTVSVSFETDKDAARKLLPRFFDLPDTALVMVSAINYHGVDYLGGRSYAEVLVGISAVFGGRDGPIKAPYMPVLWVSGFLPAVAGREFMGHAKLHGEIPETIDDGGIRRFECSEYGSLLLRGEAYNLKPLEGDQVEKASKATADTLAFGWKFIPSAEGTPDADYPVQNRMLWNYRKMWTGNSRLEFLTPDETAAPSSSAVLAALSALPIREYRRSFVGRGSAVIDRSGTRRLYPASEAET